MGRIVVNDQMDIKVFWHMSIDEAQELEEFLMTVPRLALHEDVSSSDVKGIAQGK